MKLRVRRILVIVVAVLGTVTFLITNPENYETVFIPEETTEDLGGGASELNGPLAIDILELLEVKGRAPKTGYKREMFYSGWPTVDGCNLRQRILKREFGESAVLEGCTVIAGEYDEPYAGEHMVFKNKEEVSKIQIDHVVALSDAWQKGAQYMSYDIRNAIATDPLNLLAVNGAANQGKSDGDAATWLPSNKAFRCQYVARQISVKYKYGMWVTESEKEAMEKVLGKCPKEPAVGVEMDKDY